MVQVVAAQDTALTLTNVSVTTKRGGATRMARNKPLVSEIRNYLVTTVAQAREITTGWLSDLDLGNVITLGLPEVDDRYHIWRVPLCSGQGVKIGEVVIDAYTTEILPEKTTRPEMLEARLLQKHQVRTTKSRQ